MTAFRVWHEVNLNNWILQHELMSVSISYAKTRGILHSANKFVLAGVLAQEEATPTTVSLDGSSCLLINAQALLRALAKLPNTETFEDYVRTFANSVYKMGATNIVIDVTCDYHRSESIKEGRITKRKKGQRPVRRQI